MRTGDVAVDDASAEEVDEAPGTKISLKLLLSVAVCAAGSTVCCLWPSTGSGAALFAAKEDLLSRVALPVLSVSALPVVLPILCAFVCLS